ncbi:YrhB domain-containing protein [Mucilaginibacter sp.]
MKTQQEIQCEIEYYLNSTYLSPDDKLIILGDETIDNDSYYVFFYVNERYLKTNDMSDLIVGNAPIIVDKETGSKYVTGTAFPIEHYMAEYEKSLK